MFVYYYVHLRGRPEELCHRLETEGERVAALARTAVRATTRIVHPADSRLSLGRGLTQNGCQLLPLSWTVPSVFAELTGDLRLEQIDVDETKLTLRASYPARRDGQERETHSLAEELAKRFLDSLQALEEAPETT